MQAVVFFIILTMISYVLGTFWHDEATGMDGVAFRLCTGFISVLAVVEVLGIPMTLWRMSLHIQTMVFAIALIGLCLGVVIREKGNIHPKRIAADIWKRAVSLNRYERIYIVAFLVLLAVQIYYTLFYNMGWWESDDGGYVVYSSAGIHDDGMYLSDVTFGSRTVNLELKRIFMCINNFFAASSLISGVPAAIMQHTVMAVFFLIFAYMCNYLLADGFIRECDNRWIFMVIISLAYLYGMFGEYSVTFRLLGPIWQGKAVLAVAILPFILYFYPKIYQEEFSIKTCALIVVLSMAAVSLTLGGIVTMFVVTGVLGFVYTIRRRDWKAVIYFACGCVFPLIIAIYYLMNR